MRTYKISHTDLEVSRIAYGCMTIGGTWDSTPLAAGEREAAFDALTTAYELGINFFDHADIYTRGKSEAVFGEWLAASPGRRDSLILQSKCGIRFDGDPGPGDPGRYDFSYAHIVRSVEGSLRRLQTDRLDLLLLHRPDPLVAPEEVARAFDELGRDGKVRYFGVSNHTAAQIELLRRYVGQPLVVNQVELSLAHAHLINEGIVANQVGGAAALASGILDYCRVNDIFIQAWSPVGGGRLFDPPPALQRAAELVAQMAREKQTSPEGIVLGWLLLSEKRRRSAFINPTHQ